MNPNFSTNINPNLIEKPKPFSNVDKNALKATLPLLIILLIVIPLLAFFFLPKESPEDLAQRKLDEKILAEAEDYAEKYPITSILPYVGENFRVDYGLCGNSENILDDENFCLRVSALSSGLNSALLFLTSLENYDIADYSVEFPDFSCPFDASSLDPSSLSLTSLGNNYYLAPLSFENYANTKITYKIILKKSGSSYSFVTSPEFIFTYNKYPSLEKNLLSSANKLML